MRNRLDTIRSKESGFTLVELLIVITILGVLAAIVVFSAASITNNSASNACKSDVASVNGALEAWRATNPTYPDTLASLWTGAAPLLKSSPTFGDKQTLAQISSTYSKTAGTFTVTC